MKSGSFFDGRYGQTNFHSNPTKMHQNASFSYLKYKNFGILKLQRDDEGEGNGGEGRGGEGRKSPALPTLKLDSPGLSTLCPAPTI
jgi:hypothetical protein